MAWTGLPDFFEHFPLAPGIWYLAFIFIFEERNFMKNHNNVTPTILVIFGGGGDLTWRKQNNNLSSGDTKYLEQSRSFLVDELALATGLDPQATLFNINQAIQQPVSEV